MFIATRYRRGGQPANIRAFHVERDATRHRLNISLLQASSRAVVAGGGALVARIDAGLVLLASHHGSPS
jgi:hypothetical protein